MVTAPGLASGAGPSNPPDPDPLQTSLRPEQVRSELHEQVLKHVSELVQTLPHIPEEQTPPIVRAEQFLESWVARIPGSVGEVWP